MQKKPNKVTVKAIKQSASEKNLQKFESLENLLDDLCINVNSSKDDAIQAGYQIIRN